jgi:hypothetical protein
MPDFGRRQLSYAGYFFGLAGAVALVAMPVVGCGSESGSAAVDEGGSGSRAASPYEKVLFDFRDAAMAGEAYDAYGFAEYLPPTQRAAIDAFCFIADRVLKKSEAEGLEGPALTRRVTRKAESDLKSERNIVAPGPARRAIGKLWAVLRLESLDRDLAGNYVRACYHA